VPLLGEGTRESRLAPGVTELDPETRVLLDARASIARGAGIPDPVLVRRIADEEGVSEREARARLPLRYPDHGTPLPGGLTLTRAERGGVEAAVGAYNAEIRSVADLRGAVVVDLGAVFREWDRGIQLGGIPLSDELLVGGLISLDGIHPTSLGYALVAAAFVDAINGAFGTDVPAVDVGAYLAPLELPSGAPDGSTGEP